MMRWHPRRSWWARVPHKRRHRCALDWQLHQSEWFPVSIKSMLPLRSVAKWHESFRPARLQRPAPGTWRLRERVRRMRAERLG